MCVTGQTSPLQYASLTCLLSALSCFVVSTCITASVDLGLAVHVYVVTCTVD